MVTIQDKTIAHAVPSGDRRKGRCDLREAGVKSHDLYFFKDIVVELRKGYTEA
jgi:hypothetical protein